MTFEAKRIGIPADRMKALREAFSKVMSDRDVLVDARKKDWSRPQ